jgi:hypothetical protein
MCLLTCRHFAMNMRHHDGSLKCTCQNLKLQMNRMLSVFRVCRSVLPPVSVRVCKLALGDEGTDTKAHTQCFPQGYPIHLTLHAPAQIMPFGIIKIRPYMG